MPLTFCSLTWSYLLVQQKIRCIMVPPAKEVNGMRGKSEWLEESLGIVCHCPWFCTFNVGSHEVAHVAPISWVHTQTHYAVQYISLFTRSPLCALFAFEGVYESRCHLECNYLYNIQCAVAALARLCLTDLTDLTVFV